MAAIDLDRAESGREVPEKTEERERERDGEG